LKVHIRFSSTDGSLTVDEIVRNAGGDPSTRSHRPDGFSGGQTLSGHHVYMCGPLPMVQAFEKKFIEAKVPAENIHYEEFNFR
jgi:predicted ferric reductase